MAKRKIKLISLFGSKNDVRKYLSIDMNDELKEHFEQEYDIQSDLIDKILDEAEMYVDFIPGSKSIEIEVEEES